MLFILILPNLLIFIIPIALFIAVISTYNRLIRDNEIAILKSSGLTKIQIGKSTIWLAIIASAFCFLVSSILMPYANKKLRMSRIDFGNNYASLLFNPGTFETINKLTIYTKNRDEEGNLSGILLHDKRNADYSIAITANNGKIIMKDNMALLYMETGTLQRFNLEKRNTETLYFDSYVFNLSENEKNKANHTWKASERYFDELINPQDEDINERDLREYYIEIHQRFTYPILSLIFTMIAIAAVMSGDFNRRGNFKNTIIAIIMAVTFITIQITSYNLLKVSPDFIVLLYGNIIVFTIITILMLSGKANFRSILK